MLHRRVLFLMILVLVLGILGSAAGETLSPEGEAEMREQAALWLGYSAEEIADLPIRCTPETEYAAYYAFECPEGEAFDRLRRCMVYPSARDGVFQMNLSPNLDALHEERAAGRDMGWREKLQRLKENLSELYPFLDSGSAYSEPFATLMQTEPQIPEFEDWGVIYVFPPNLDHPLQGKVVRLSCLPMFGVVSMIQIYDMDRQP